MDLHSESDDLYGLLAEFDSGGLARCGSAQRMRQGIAK